MLTHLSIVLAVALGVGGADRAKPVEHWRAEKGGYALTFYPGFASRAFIEEPSGEIVELYRQSAPFDVRDGLATKHQIRLNGASLDESVAIAIDDRKHDIAVLRIALYADGGVRTLVIENTAQTCPPTCDVAPKAAGPVYASRMLADVGRFDAPETSVSTRGYDVAFYGGFASRITSSVAGELFRQSAPFQLGDSAVAGRHQVRIAGGPSQRDITLGVIDGEHQVAEIRVVLHGGTNETIDLKNRAVTCPPDC